MNDIQSNLCNVIQFSSQNWTSRRFTAHDQAQACAWERIAGRDGYVQVSFEAAADDRVADTLLVYKAGELWRVAGSRPPGRRFGLWHHASGVRMGEFPTVWAALEAISFCAGHGEPGRQGDGWLPAARQAP